MYVTLPVRIALAGFLALRRRWWHLAAFAGAVIMSELLIGPLKGAYDRPRPPGSLVATSGGSFPSGHAVAASVTVIAAVIALVPPGRRRALWGAVAVAFAILMGLSRAYLAAHWLSDATAGIPARHILRPNYRARNRPVAATLACQEEPCRAATRTWTTSLRRATPRPEGDQHRYGPGP